MQLRSDHTARRTTEDYFALMATQPVLVEFGIMSLYVVWPFGPIQTRFTDRDCMLMPAVNEVRDMFYYLPHTSGAERDAAPSPSPQQSQPQ